MIEYITRSRAYYGAQGYKPYQWAKNTKTPFTQLQKPLANSRLVLVTTAAPFRSELPDQGPGAAYNANAKFFDVFTQPATPTPDLRISHIGYDRVHCQADDARTWLPNDVLRAAVADGTLGELADEVIGVPTNRSQRVTREQDAPIALEHAQRLQAGVALLVPT